MERGKRGAGDLRINQLGTISRTKRRAQAAIFFLVLPQCLGNVPTNINYIAAGATTRYDFTYSYTHTYTGLFIYVPSMPQVSMAGSRPCSGRKVSFLLEILATNCSLYGT